MAYGKSSNYFDMISDLASAALEAADTLRSVFSSFSVSGSEKAENKLDLLNKKVQSKKSNIRSRLQCDFITPLERGDIFLIAGGICGTVESISEVLGHIVIYRIMKIRPHALELAEILQESCAGMYSLFGVFYDYRNNGRIQPHIDEITRLDGKAEDIYKIASAALYREASNPVEIIVWISIYDRLRDCCRACRAVSETVEYIILKNS